MKTVCILPGSAQRRGAYIVIDSDDQTKIGVALGPTVWFQCDVALVPPLPGMGALRHLVNDVVSLDPTGDGTMRAGGCPRPSLLPGRARRGTLVSPRRGRAQTRS